MDYSSMKVPELKKLLQGRELPVAGNKADLIARLQQDDEKKDEGAPKPAGGEDEIDYSDDDVQIGTEAAKPANTASAPAGAAADSKTAATANGDGAPTSAGTATAVPTAGDDAKGDGTATADGAAATTTDDEPKQTFHPTLNLPATDADKEAEKRAARAKRFGIEEDEETRRKADRAKRFGIDVKDLATGLDAALPERQRKRGRVPQDDGEGGGKRQSMERGGDNLGRRGGARAGRRGHGRGGGRGGGGGGGVGGRGGGRFQGRRGGGGGGMTGNSKGGNIMDDPTEKAKAERRAQRFAA